MKLQNMEMGHKKIEVLLLHELLNIFCGNQLFCFLDRLNKP